MWFCGQLLYSFDRSHPALLFYIHNLFYSVTTQHQNIVNNTQFWLHVSVYQTTIRPGLIISKYIQCVHTLCDSMLFTPIKAKIIPSFNTVQVPTHWYDFLHMFLKIQSVNRVLKIYQLKIKIIKNWYDFSFY